MRLYIYMYTYWGMYIYGHVGCDRHRRVYRFIDQSRHLHTFTDPVEMIYICIYIGVCIRICVQVGCDQHRRMFIDS